MALSCHQQELNLCWFCLLRLQTTNTTSLAALEKLKADLEAKRQGKSTPPPLSPKLASSAPVLPSAGSLISPRSRVCVRCAS
jgi:hypothetical protein